MAVKQLKFVKSNSKSASGIYDYIARRGEYRHHVDKCLITGYENLPLFAEGDPALFWKMADKYERANAKCCTHVVVALPRELGLEAQACLMDDFVKRNFKGCPLSWAIHEGYDQHNPHAHLQICERRINSEKEATFAAKRFFKRNGVKKDRTLNNKSFCSHLYRQYAGSINYHLEQSGSEERLNEEPQSKEFLEMSFLEKLKRQMDRQIEELKEKHLEELNKLREKEKENVWQRDTRSKSKTDGIRKEINKYERERGEAGKESRGLRRNAQRKFERKQNSSKTEFGDFKEAGKFQADTYKSDSQSDESRILQIQNLEQRVFNEDRRGAAGDKRRQEYGRGVEGTSIEYSEHFDRSSGRVALGTGSKEDAGISGVFGRAWQNLMNLTGSLWRAVFKRKLLRKLFQCKERALQQKEVPEIKLERSPSLEAFKEIEDEIIEFAKFEKTESQIRSKKQSISDYVNKQEEGQNRGVKF